MFVVGLVESLLAIENDNSLVVAAIEVRRAVAVVAHVPHTTTLFVFAKSFALGVANAKLSSNVEFCCQLLAHCRDTLARTQVPINLYRSVAYFQKKKY